MKKILFVLMVILISKTASAQTPKHIEVVLSDTLLSGFDTVYWRVDIFVDYSSVNIDSSILKQKNPILENKARRASVEDSTKKLLNILNTTVKNMKDVYVAPDVIIDNVKEYSNSPISFTYITASDAGMRDFITYCDQKKVNVSISSIKHKNNEADEILLRKKLSEKSKKIAIALLPNFNGKSVELISISQTDPMSKSNFNNTQSASMFKQLLNDNIDFKIASKLTLKFDYIIK